MEHSLGLGDVPCQPPLSWGVPSLPKRKRVLGLRPPSFPCMPSVPLVGAF